MGLENKKFWNDMGMWQWPCGCAEFQDGWEKCEEHSGKLISSDPSIQDQVVDNSPITTCHDTFTGQKIKVYSAQQINPKLERINKGLPTDPKERKGIPIWSGVIMYFPLTLAEIAKVSLAGNDQHNPNEPLHWAKEKSTDHMNTSIRHQVDHGMGNEIDTDGTRHLAKAIWRLMAELETKLEKEKATC